MEGFSKQFLKTVLDFFRLDLLIFSSKFYIPYSITIS